MTAAAAVATARLAVAGDRIRGYAASATGPRPCVLRLEAGGAPIAIARATGFARAAATAGLRFGWCAVELPGLRLAAGLADVAQVRCDTSGRLLLEVPLPVKAPRPDPAPLPITMLRERMRAADRCADIEQILPFAFATFNRGGAVALVEACYRSLLRRAPEPAVIARWQATDMPDPVRGLLRSILTSPEHGEGGGFIPGPFHPDFAFDRSILDR